MLHTRRLLLKLQLPLHILTRLRHLILLYLLDLFLHWLINLCDIVHELIKRDNKHQQYRYHLPKTGLMVEVHDTQAHSENLSCSNYEGNHVLLKLLDHAVNE